MNLKIFQFTFIFFGNFLNGCTFMYAQEAVQQQAVQQQTVQQPQIIVSAPAPALAQGQAWNQTDYEAWKQEQIERSKSYHYTQPRHIEELLEKCDQAMMFKDLFIQKMALYAYNVLRELHNEHVEKQIDLVWLNQIRYENFKENKKLTWQNRNDAFVEQIDDLLQNVHEYLP